MRAQASIAIDGLGDHRQVDVDAVALVDAEALERVGEALHLAVQVGVGERAGVAGLALEEDGHLVAVAGRRRGDRGSCADVEPAADEPLGVREVPLEDGVPVVDQSISSWAWLAQKPSSSAAAASYIAVSTTRASFLNASEGAKVRCSQASASIVSFVSSAMFGPRCRR